MKKKDQKTPKGNIKERMKIGKKGSEVIKKGTGKKHNITL